jgi:hypothetical protein
MGLRLLELISILAQMQFVVLGARLCAKNCVKRMWGKRHATRAG